MSRLTEFLQTTHCTTITKQHDDALSRPIAFSLHMALSCWLQSMHCVRLQTAVYTGAFAFNDVIISDVKQREN